MEGRVISAYALETLFLMQTKMQEVQEAKLACSVIALGVIDYVFGGDEDAEKFIRGSGMKFWADLIDLDRRFVLMIVNQIEKLYHDGEIERDGRKSNGTATKRKGRVSNGKRI